MLISDALRIKGIDKLNPHREKTCTVPPFLPPAWLALSRRLTRSAADMEPEDDALAAELELLQAMYTVEEDELCITTAPGSTEVAMRLRPQTGGERAQRFMEVVLQLRCGDGYPSEGSPTIRLQRARGFVEDEEAQLLCGVHARAAELQGKHCPAPAPAPALSLLLPLPLHLK